MPRSELPSGSVVAVVATHRPQPDLLARLRTTLPQVERLVVVDDGSGAASSALLDSIATLGPSVEVLRLDRNLGIAAALNAGAGLALERGADFVLTLDQDSTLHDDYVVRAKAAFDLLQGAGRRPAAVAAGVQSGATVRPVVSADAVGALRATAEAIQSGLLVPRATFERCGLFDESLFIDCVDSEFVLRAAAAGLLTYLDPASRIEHELGRELPLPTGRLSRSGRTTLAFHPPWRRYYITRNRGVLLLRFAVGNPRWALMSSAGELVQFARCLVFGPQKLRQAGAAAAGVVDTVIGRRGRLSGLRSLLVGFAG